MHRFEIQLSDSLQRFLESQAADYGFGSVGDFVHALLEDEHRRHLSGAIEEELIKGLDSGPPIEVDAKFWEGFRARYRRRLAAGA